MQRSPDPSSFATVCVNGGAGVAIYLAKQIYEHRSALKAWGWGVILGKAHAGLEAGALWLPCPPAVLKPMPVSRPLDTAGTQAEVTQWPGGTAPIHVFHS